ncbi:unnamed protein product [Nezara viridula]|uniref:Uncharacterized protein n=1 Tax=Nezara viridula TaxID=85310 RepID=A0A9P0MHA4_NEZVI|nr:unnamed protein product [Nezara viridula]
MDDNPRAAVFNMDRLLAVLLVFTILGASQTVLALDRLAEDLALVMAGLRRCFQSYCCPMEYRCSSGLKCVDGTRSTPMVRCITG